MSPRKSASSRSKKEQARSACPIASALDLIGDKWTLLVVRDLTLGCKRYGDFLASPEGYPTNILADRLKRLEGAGLIDRVLYSKRPPRAEYFLNDKGKTLAPILAELSAWGLAHIPGSAVWERDVEPEASDAETPPAEPVEAPSPPAPEETAAFEPATAVEEEPADIPESPVAEEPEAPALVEEPEGVDAEDAATVDDEAMPAGNGHAESEAPALEPETEPGAAEAESAPDDFAAVASEPVSDSRPVKDDPQDQMSLW